MAEETTDVAAGDWYSDCVNEVKTMQPPGVMCDYSRCMRIQQVIDKTCHNRHWEPGHPYALDNPDGSICYCCCSCFAYDTPIQVNANTFKFIQDFLPGEPVLAAGADLQWKTATVRFSSGSAPDPQGEGTFMVTIIYNNPAGERQVLLATEDNLFLTPARTLVPAKLLAPGNQLLRPDGSAVSVISAVSGLFKGGVHHIDTGVYNGTMDGHLLNANGIVSADFALQLGYMTAQLDRSLLVEDIESRLKVGSPQYQEQHGNTVPLDMIENPEAWPKGFSLIMPDTWVKIPATAHKFITDEQAKGIMDSNPPSRSFTSNFGLELLNHQFTTFRGFYPQPHYLYDWNNNLPNAYAWEYRGQPIIMLTGGLARLYALNNEGLSLIISHSLASLYGGNPTNPEQLRCVGPADYEAVLSYMGTIWWDQAYKETVNRAIGQIKNFFNLIPPEYAGGPEDRCLKPSVECRMRTYQAAMSTMPLPWCANPDAREFEVVDAIPSTGTVVVNFSEEVNADTAETATNYVLQPAVEVTSAKVASDNFKSVTLEAQIQAGVEYVLTVNDVISAHDRPLEDHKNTATFTLQP